MDWNARNSKKVNPTFQSNADVLFGVRALAMFTRIVEM